MIKSNLILLLLLAVLTACAEQATKTGILVPVEERNVPVTQNKKTVRPGQESETRQEIKQNNENKPEQSVIIALLGQADSHAKAGNSEKAAATIERALRIEPGNALLWSRFAAIRLQQQQWQQAIALARKSNALAGNNDALRSNNWGIIADAYEKIGDKQKAKEARQKQKRQG